MLRQVSTVALVVMAVGGVAIATAEEPKESGKTKSPPKEVTVDLGKGVKLDLVLIPAGEFLMGSGESAEATVAFLNKTYGGGFLKADWFNDEHPQHRVRISKPFYLGKYLVTQEQWEVVMGNNPSEFKGPKNPVETVSWNYCQQILKRLNDKVGGGKFQLPTEAQWEYACRAGSKTRYCFGDDALKLGEYAWFRENSVNTTHPVGEKKPNAWGLYDMHGNVWEWCADWWKDGYYKESPGDDPTGAATGSDRVYRGGCWSYPARYCRLAYRNSGPPGYRFNYLGLRVSRVPAIAAEPKPNETKQITNSIGMKLTLVPSGEFLMGSKESAEETAAFFNKTYGIDALKADFFKNEHPQHRVRITKPFYLGTFDVTRGQFQKFVTETKYKTDAEKGENPGAVGWNQDKKIFEFNEQYSWRNVGFEQTDEHPAVNVTWHDAVAFCVDKQYYVNSRIDDPTGPDSGDGRVLRGGSFLDGPYATRSAVRNWESSGDRLLFNKGFRVARTP